MIAQLDCEFEQPSRSNVHIRAYTLGNGIKPPIPPAMSKIISLMLFYKDGFGIK